MKRAFGTGLRPSEQIALRWERIDWERNVIQIVEGWREGQLTALKVASAHREVDLLPAVRKALERQRLVAGGSELVFPNSRTTCVAASSIPRSRRRGSTPL